VRAQITYQPYPDTYATWFYQHMNSFGEVDSYTRVILSGDTIVNGQSYNKIYRGSSQTGSMNPPPVMTYRGGMRQNTATQQTFFIDESGTEYDISIDHSLHVGDTAPVTPYMFLAFNFVKWYAPEEYAAGDMITKMVVTQIDTPSTYYLEFYNTDNQPEGLAAYTSGMCNTVIYFEDALQLTCWSVDGVMPPGMEMNPLSVNCSLGTDEISLTAFSVFPNPASETVVVSSGDFSGTADLHITDALGRIVSRQYYTIGDELPTGDLPEGAYFLRFAVDERTLSLPLQIVR
jgi:hypothetical protein